MQATPRQAWLDWLRILAIFGVLIFHAAMPFATDLNWHIRNKETSNILLEMNMWLHLFRMPLLFFISGTVSYYMLQSRTAGGFIKLRMTKLFIPLVFGILVIVPPQVYMERLTQGHKGSFLHFYATMFSTGPYPKGNLSWHHLWFILYLVLYDLVCAPLFAWIVANERFRERLAWLAKGKRIYLLTLPGIFVYTAFTLQYPETNAFWGDWAYMAYWLLFLIPGFLCIANPLLMDSLERNRKTTFIIAFLSLIAINVVRWNDLSPWDVLPEWRNDYRTYVFIALQSLCGWAWVLTCIGYGKKKLNRQHPVLPYLNEAVYPFYILHQTVIVILAYYVVKAPDEVTMKYAFIVLVTGAVCMAVFHYFIRPYPLMRWLFGMKKSRKLSA
ncbi:acyltransferase family protein [Chitinophaga sancti]|uniref:Acyltransferase family protein n=1 Tax=Chitinophaga sancti TaxID=1004 RepID=A0A1K1SCE2_9BACT|nr:acyltransferase family protein [Chitinophaga sancti]WQD63556.1 acyltransferase family protein [Chitinophaga sancti]WQG90818.1 acyltransferase family protein [Chitinophaga sancti]SFW81709.1 Peptidoglycan/LPS O-acetylase OafA/YrhL, contains acyltransferase and SGNH-hydrolase domains [Chitinophaga sancti]